MRTRSRQVGAADYFVGIAPALRRHVTVLDVIQSAGTLFFASPGVELRRRRGQLIEVRAEEYRFTVGVHDGHVVVGRNGQSVASEIPDTQASVGDFVRWDPTRISAVNGVLGSTWDEASITAQTVQAFSDPPVILPTGMIAWARRQALVPVRTYDSRDDGIGAITLALRSLEDKIEAHAMQHAFWDLRREGNRIVSRLPKRETDIHPTLGALLSDVAIVRNLEVVREQRTGAGDLDFALLAPLTEGGVARASAEFKSAHSDDLIHGVTQQLPDYMRSEGSDYGFYGVLWFKGEHFTQPSSAETPAALQVQLDIATRQVGFRNVRVLVLDLTYPRSASQRR